MAIYYLGMRTFGRARGKRGSRATSGAAYRSGERIRDDRSGAVYDYRNRRDVLHKEILLPSRFSAVGSDLDWARDRSALWNAAETVERYKNARVAREFTVALPHELSPERRAALARRFGQEISDRYGNAVDLAIHAPRGDPRNFHAHLFTTTREVTPQGLGPKTTLELSGTERHRRGLSRWAEELAYLHERWATLANETLKEAHIESRLAAISRTEALSRAAVPRLPLAAYHMERRGLRSFVAERIRERHRAELARQVGLSQAAHRGEAHKGSISQANDRASDRASGRVSDRTNDRASEAARKWAADRGTARWGPVKSTEDLRREAVRNWLEHRQPTHREEAPERERTRTPSHDYDLGL